jgi:signal transduction histidine kinase
MERDAVVIASLIENDVRTSGPGAASRVEAVIQTYADETGARVAVTDETGTVIADTEPTVPGARSFASRPEIRRALDGGVATGTRQSRTLGTDLLFVAVPVAASGSVFGTVRITYTGSEITARVRTYWLLLAGVAAITLAAVTGIGLLLARWVARPLARLEEVADAVGEGDLAARAPEAEGPPEVRALAHRFNVMVGQLDELVGAQEAFVADASHQLRTPLTAVRLRIENLGHAAGDAGRDDAEAAIAEVDRLSRLVDSLLALARAERREAPSAPRDLSRLVADRVEAWRDLAAESGVTLADRVEPGLRAVLVDGAIEQVLDNLLDNAVQASAPSGEVSIEARRTGDRLEIRVADRGRGMSADERAHAFDRFWRSPLSAPGGGSGLGLPIVAGLVRAAGGTVTLEETPGGGLTAVVTLPRA